METKREEQTPLYTHDCDTCIYLGRSTYFAIWEETLACDVYYCVGTKNHGGEYESIVVRWKNEQEFYSSWPYFVFYLKRCEEENESENGKKLLVPYLFGLEQASARGLLLKDEN